jgi:hypothetical protein
MVSLAQDRWRAGVHSVDAAGRRSCWHIQVYAGLEVESGIKNLVLDSPVPVVFDHFGGARAAPTPDYADVSPLA